MRVKIKEKRYSCLLARHEGAWTSGPLDCMQITGQHHAISFYLQIEAAHCQAGWTPQPLLDTSGDDKNLLLLPRIEARSSIVRLMINVDSNWTPLCIATLNVQFGVRKGFHMRPILSPKLRNRCQAWRCLPAPIAYQLTISVCNDRSPGGCNCILSYLKNSWTTQCIV